MSQRDITVPGTENFFYPRKPIEVDQCWHVTPDPWAGLDLNPGQGNMLENFTRPESSNGTVLLLSEIIAAKPHVAIESLKYG